MQITDQMITHIANLSKLELSPEEMIRAKADMEQMLTYFGQLQKMDTADTEPMHHVCPQVNVFREDEAAGGCEAAPREYAVPRTIG